MGVVEVVYDWLVIHVGHTHASHAKRPLATAKHVGRIVNCTYHVSVRYKNMIMNKLRPLSVYSSDMFCD